VFDKVTFEILENLNLTNNNIDKNKFKRIIDNLGSILKM